MFQSRVYPLQVRRSTATAIRLAPAPTGLRHVEKIASNHYANTRILPDVTGLYEQGRAVYEKGGLNLANRTDEQQIEAEDDYRICVRRGSDEEAKPKKASAK